MQSVVCICDDEGTTVIDIKVVLRGILIITVINCSLMSSVFDRLSPSAPPPFPRRLRVKMNPQRQTFAQKDNPAKLLYRSTRMGGALATSNHPIGSRRGESYEAAWTASAKSSRYSKWAFACMTPNRTLWGNLRVAIKDGGL